MDGGHLFFLIMFEIPQQRRCSAVLFSTFPDPLCRETGPQKLCRLNRVACLDRHSKKGHYLMPKGVPNKRYTPEFKKLVNWHSIDLVGYTISERPVLSRVTTMRGKAFETIPHGTGRFSTPTRVGNTSISSINGCFVRKMSDRACVEKVTAWTMLSSKISLVCSKANCFICKNLISWRT